MESQHASLPKSPGAAETPGGQGVRMKYGHVQTFEGHRSTTHTLVARCGASLMATREKAGVAGSGESGQPDARGGRL